MIAALLDFLVANPGVFGTLLGTIFGAVLGFSGNVFMQSLQRRRLRTFAGMQVATNLRHWINQVVGRIYDLKNHLSSEGHFGAECGTLPDFRFEGSLGEVSQLDPKVAKNIFNLVHGKDSANEKIRVTDDFQGRGDAIEEFFLSSARLCLAASAVHKAVSKSVGWSDDILSDDLRSMLNALAK